MTLSQLQDHWKLFAICKYPNGLVVGISKMAFTWSILVNIDEMVYERRYCYEKLTDAVDALNHWDGNAYPPGPWIKEKPSNREGPGSKES